jgi:hypothetical protein
MRGVMLFEDYNYNNHNKYVLIDPTKESDAESEQEENNAEEPIGDKDSRSGKRLGFSAPPMGEAQTSDDPVRQVALTDNLLE